MQIAQQNPFRFGGFRNQRPGNLRMRIVIVQPALLQIVEFLLILARKNQSVRTAAMHERIPAGVGFTVAASRAGRVSGPIVSFVVGFTHSLRARFSTAAVRPARKMALNQRIALDKNYFCHLRTAA